MTKKRLLYVGDGGGTTGFSQVAYGLLKGLHESGEFEIVHLAINYLDLGPNDWPWARVPAGFYHKNGGRFEADDPFGTHRLQTWVLQWQPDVVIVNNDFPIANIYMQEPDGSPTPLAKSSALKVLYAPLDSQPCPPVFAEFASKWDITIAYTFWQRELMKEVDPAFTDMPVMYHGVDLDTYAPMDKREAKERLEDIFANHNNGKAPKLVDKYIVYSVGTNQFRKDHPALFRAYADFRKRVKNAFLIPHTAVNPSGINGGWNLRNLAAISDVKDAVLMDNASQFSQAEMAVFMNAADVLAYPTRGEGFGIPSLEAMATKTPVVATKFGPQRELHENGRGYFIKVLDSVPGEPGCLTWFALPDWKDLARQLYHVYSHPEEAKTVAERAHKWVQQHTWQSKSDQLAALITEALAARSAPLAEAA